MNLITRSSLALYCCTALGATVLAQGDPGPSYQCTPSRYEMAGVTLDCRGAGKSSENCEPFDLRVADLVESGGSYVHSETTQTDGSPFVDTVTIERATGAFTETETLGGVLVARTVGVCELKKGTPKG